MEILLASHNKNKIKELETLLSAAFPQIRILSMSDVGFTDAIVEDGMTFEENALIKSRFGAAHGYITVADDSGLTVDALGGAPGVYSARYAGEPCSDEKNNRKLLDALFGVPPEKRGAKFVSVVTCSFPDGRPEIIAYGECRGSILTAPRGDGGFGYDPLFYYPPFDLTFAQMSDDEKNEISHRGAAMRNFAVRFSDIVKSK